MSKSKLILAISLLLFSNSYSLLNAIKTINIKASHIALVSLAIGFKKGCQAEKSRNLNVGGSNEKNS